jgi:hypothetical protein
MNSGKDFSFVLEALWVFGDSMRHKIPFTNDLLKWCVCFMNNYIVVSIKKTIITSKVIIFRFFKYSVSATRQTPLFFNINLKLQ